MCDVKLLDVGFVLQLEQHVSEAVDGHPLWCSRFLYENPAAVVSVHRDLVRVGSQIIHTNTYQATVDGFSKHMGLTRESALELIGKGVALAKEAIDLEKKDGEVEIAGSVGPYGASLNDGSEYSGSYADQVSIEELMHWHEDRIQKLVSSGVDLLAFETIPCIKEAVALIRLLQRFPHVGAWVSFSIKDDAHISNGERFVDAVEAVLKEAEDAGVSDQLIAVGMNCVNPKLVSTLLTGAKAKFPDQPFIVYPNTGEHYNTQLKRWEVQEEIKPLSDYVEDWLDLGVKYVGGCCRTTSKDLPAISVAIKKWEASKKINTDS